MTSVLYVGGTGTISHSCVRASVAHGHDVHVLNRGRTAPLRPLPPEVTVLTGDVQDPDSVRGALRGRRFDAIVDFLTFDAAQARRAVELYAGRTAHYLYVSSASVYHKPVLKVPVTESAPRRNPFSRYSRDKIEAEDVFMKRIQKDLRGPSLPIEADPARQPERHHDRHRDEKDQPADDQRQPFDTSDLVIGGGDQISERHRGCVERTA